MPSLFLRRKMLWTLVNVSFVFSIHRWKKPPSMLTRPSLRPFSPIRVLRENVAVMRSAWKRVSTGANPLLCGSSVQGSLSIMTAFSMSNAPDGITLSLSYSIRAPKCLSRYCAAWPVIFVCTDGVCIATTIAISRTTKKPAILPTMYAFFLYISLARSRIIRTTYKYNIFH